MTAFNSLTAPLHSSIGDTNSWYFKDNMLIFIRFLYYIETKVILTQV